MKRNDPSRRGRTTAIATVPTSGGSGRDEAIRVGPLTQLLLELLALVDHDLAVVGERDLEPLQGPRRGALEVDPGDVEAAAVARAFEFLLGGQPVGRAAQVRADRLERVDDILAVVLWSTGRSRSPTRP